MFSFPERWRLPSRHVNRWGSDRFSISVWSSVVRRRYCISFSSYNELKKRDRMHSPGWKTYLSRCQVKLPFILRRQTLRYWCRYEKIKDTKAVIRSCKLKKDRKHNGQTFEDTKGVIWSRKTDRQYNGEKKKGQAMKNIRQKPTYWATQFVLMFWGELRYSGKG
jgi:hypothetical protein